MKLYFRVALSILITCFCFSVGSCQSNSNLKIVIIRHGEKPDEGSNLNCQGLSRALQLPKVIKAKFGVPSIIFVPAVGTGEKTRYSRMFQTATPLAVKYNLTINSSYGEEDYKHIAKDVKSQSGTVLMVWEHKAISEIVNALGVDGDHNWPSDDFDSIWIITFKNGKAVLTKDKEGINPVANCPF